MRADEAFYEWASDEYRHGVRAGQVLREVLRDGPSHPEFIAWLEESGIYDRRAESAYRSYDADVCAAITLLTSAPYLATPEQIAVALVGDLGASSWHLHGFANHHGRERDLPLDDAARQAVYLLASCGRPGAPRAHESLLVWPDGRPWSGWQVRYALRRAQRAVGRAAGPSATASP